jgi:transposase InsO family protein
MPWQESTIVQQRRAFCVLAEQGAVPFGELCGRFGISRPTGYRWIKRFATEGETGLSDHSHRPTRCPHQTPAAIEALVGAARVQHPAWGGRKLHHWLVQQGHPNVPAPSTITAILQRQGLLAEPFPEAAAPWQRFEADGPNALWQLDFTAMLHTRHGRCTPLLVLDDHSRYILGAQALPDQTSATVQAALTTVFRCYGLPWRLLGDNGGPWGTAHAGVRLTRLIAWLARLGVAVSHGRPYHPQTQGKVERCVRTLGAEVLRRFDPASPAVVQARLDAWRETYNHERPHGALNHQPPASRYRLSPRPFPEVLPPIAYEPDAWLTRVTGQGFIVIERSRYYLSEVIKYEEVELRPQATDRVSIWYGPICLTELPLGQAAHHRSGPRV